VVEVGISSCCIVLFLLLQLLVLVGVESEVIVVVN